jgi:acylphosphatase
VQGVFYRARTEEIARQLGVTGWVRNMPDGSVELLACGDADQLTALRQWCRQGPPAAQVDEVACKPAASENITGFSIRY